MKNDTAYSHYISNVSTVGANHDPESREAKSRVRMYLDGLIVTYSEMEVHDKYKTKVYSEILAVTDFLKRDGK